MPVYRSRTFFELVRGVKAFLNLDVGLVRGEALEPEQQIRAQAQKLRQAQNRTGRQGRQLEQMRKLLSEKNQRVAALQADPDAGSGGPREIADSGEETEYVVERFHKLYYDSAFSGGTWHNTYWLGVPTWKCPLDLWVYQEIIFDLKPDLIIESGTAFGGSALFLACMCDLIDKGKVITIDVEDVQSRPQHNRLQYLLGSSTAEETIDQIRPYAADGAKVMVILDSDHRKDHVLSELHIYSRFVTKGSYIVVEDTNINGHPVWPDYGPGPMEAVQDFLEVNGEFVVDRSKEKFYLTYNPKGYLKRI